MEPRSTLDGITDQQEGGVEGEFRITNDFSAFAKSRKTSGDMGGVSPQKMRRNRTARGAKSPPLSTL